MSGKTNAGRELEVMEINELANEVVGPELFQFNRERILGIGKTSAPRKGCSGGITDLTH